MSKCNLRIGRSFKYQILECLNAPIETRVKLAKVKNSNLLWGYVQNADWISTKWNAHENFIEKSFFMSNLLGYLENLDLK